MSYTIEHIKEQRIRKFNVQGHHYSLSMDLSGSYADVAQALYGVIESKLYSWVTCTLYIETT